MNSQVELQTLTLMGNYVTIPIIYYAQIRHSLLSNWKHREDQQKEIIFYLFPEH